MWVQFCWITNHVKFLHQVSNTGVQNNMANSLTGALAEGDLSLTTLKALLIASIQS